MKKQISLFLEIYEGKIIGTDERLKCLEYLETCKISNDDNLKRYVAPLHKLYTENKETIENGENWLI